MVYTQNIRIKAFSLRCLLAYNEATWGHSVLSLLRRLDEIMDVHISEIEQCAKELDRHYIPSRYPDAYPSGRPEKINSTN